MIKTKTLISDIDQVPNPWIFEYYLKLPVTLDGQNLMIKSPFNPGDKIPSCSIYLPPGSIKYRFNDFSTGTRGNAADLVIELYKGSNEVVLTYGEVCRKIIGDYNQFVLDSNGYNISEFKKYTRYQVTKAVKRAWNVLDKSYWEEYEISSKELESDGVTPLESYTMDNEEKQLVIQGNYLYGYHRLDGSVYKIYQPKVTDKKFIKVKDYTQGMDQLKFSSPNLVLTASLKDRRCLLNLGFNLESIAPDSENTMIKPDTMAALTYRYKNILIMFDHDEPGQKAMLKYKERDNLECITLDMEKDIARSVKIHGSDKVRDYLAPIFKQKLL